MTFNVHKLLQLLIALSVSSILSHSALAAKLIFESGFESGTFEKDLNWRYNLYGTGTHTTRKIVSSPTGSGKHALELTILGNEYDLKERAEIIPLAPGVIPYYWDGPEYWIGYSQMIPNAFTGKVWTLKQIHPPDKPLIEKHGGCKTGSDPFVLTTRGSTDNADSLALHVLLDGTTRPATSTNTFGHGRKVLEMPMEKNLWIDWVIHFKLGTKKNGFFEVWKNGVKVYEVRNITNVQVYDSCGNDLRNILPSDKRRHYSKFGLYGNNKPHFRQVLIDDVRIAEGADGYTLVDPKRRDLVAPPAAPTIID